MKCLNISPSGQMDWEKIQMVVSAVDGTSVVKPTAILGVRGDSNGFGIAVSLETRRNVLNVSPSGQMDWEKIQMVW